MNTKIIIYTILAVMAVSGLATEKTFSQPYIYSFEVYVDEEWGHTSDIYRIDLQNGEHEMFVENAGRVLEILLTPNQEIVFAERRGHNLLITHTQTNESTTLWDIEWPHYVVDAPDVNKVFLAAGDLFNPHHLLVMNRNSFEVVDTLDNVGLDYTYTYINPNLKPFLSPSQDIMYDQVGGQEGIFFKEVDTGTLDTLSESKQCGDMGPFSFGPLLEDGSNGKAVLSYQFTSGGYSDQHYIVCDVVSYTLGQPLPFPWRSRAYLSPNAEYILIERINWVEEKEGNPEYRPGIIYIFETETGKLTQRLQLPPEGELFLFDHYPNQLFYYVDEEPAIQIDIGQVMVEAEFLNDLMQFIDEAWQEGWLSDEVYVSDLQQITQQVQNYLSDDDLQSAANELNSFIENVESVYAGNGPANAKLTSEGYALLYYNASYLLERLPEPDPGSGITCECENQITQTSGTITLSNGETACLAGDFSGSVFFESGGTLNVCGTATLQNIHGNQSGVINISESGNVSAGNWNNNNSEDAINNWGTLDFTNQVTVNNGTLTNHGTVTVSGVLNQNNGTIANHGEMTVSQSVNINQPGTVNDGYWNVNGSLNLNGNGELINSCRIEVADQLRINGFYTNKGGSFTSASGQVTVNSGGELSMEGENAMLSADQMMLNGAINSSGGVNLITIQNQFNYNSGAIIGTGDDPLYVCSPDNNALINNFDVVDGCPIVIPVSECNPDGFNN